MSILNNSNAISTGGGYTLENSLRFRESANAYLSRTPASAGNRKTWTWSSWVKRGNLGGIQHLSYASESATYADPAGGISFITDNTIEVWHYAGSGYDFRLVTTQLFRDTSAWYHIVLEVDTTQATASNRMKLYVNGTQITAFTVATYPVQNFDSAYNSTGPQLISARGSSGTVQNYLDGYMTEVNFVDGTAEDATAFGEYNEDTGVWQPIEYTGTYGTNGFYLPMKPTTQATGFNTVLYTGTGATSQNITGTGFTPDFVWIKNRTLGDDHVLQDSVRGVGINSTLISNLTNEEGSSYSTPYGYVSALNTNGFSVAKGTDSTYGNRWVNENNSKYVAWCWDAGSSTVSNTDGTITSSVRANPATGFSIVTYTGTGAVATVGHGLGTTPNIIIVKNRDIISNWSVNGNVGGLVYGTNKLLLQDTGAISADTNEVTAVTSTTFSVSNGIATNGSGNSHVAYCFADVEGYSKFGSYTGNGSADGPTVTTGFRPAFVMVKRTNDIGSWEMHDNTRSVNNPRDNRLFANLPNAEVTLSPKVDFNDTGFQLVSSNVTINASGSTYIYMAFADTRDAQFNFDASGNKNNWTANNINSNASTATTYDIMTDVPTLTDEDTSNFATLNPLGASGLVTNRGHVDLYNGNLSTSDTGSLGLWGGSESTILMSTGKHYAEFTVELSGSTALIIGINGSEVTDHLFRNASSVGYYNNGTKWINASNTAYGASYTNGDVIGVAFDADTQSVTFYKNNVSQGAIAVPSLVNRLGYSFYATIGWNGGIKPYVHANFGQRPFAYTPPTGYKKLNTFNLPDSAIENGSEYFNTVTYTGDGTSSNAITGVGFKPDLTWVKKRSNTASHNMFDIIRGVQVTLQSNATSADNDFTATVYSLKSFDTDGFTVGDTAIGDYGINGPSGHTFVAWNWKAGGTAVSNTDGTITSSVSANTTAGFSIVSYTGNATAGATIGHGLGTTPAMIIVKGRSNVDNWAVYRHDLGGTKRLLLNTTSSQNSDVAYWNNTNATSSVFTVHANAVNNGSGQTYIAYCFADVEGYSKFGSYTGNGSADGPFVYTGFKPAFVLWKRTDTAGNSWRLKDSTRNPYNETLLNLFPNSSIAENSDTAIDFVSNGFKNRSTGVNASGSTYIYMAFAENPFKNSLAR